MKPGGKPGQRALERAIAIVHVLDRLNEHEAIDEADLGHALDVIFDDLGNAHAEIMLAEPAATVPTDSETRAVQQ